MLKRHRARLKPPESSSPPGSSVKRETSGSSTTDDEYFSPATSPPPIRRRQKVRTSNSLEPRGQPALNRAPAIGGKVQRMKWTKKINENVMRAYYGATEGGSNLTAYRSRILPLFQDLEPDVNVSVQRLSDQVRAIQRCQLLDSNVLERLRTVAQGNHNNQTSLQTSNTKENKSVTHLKLTDEDLDVVNTAVSNQYNDRLRSTLEDAIQKYRHMQPDLRPRLPRLPIHKKNMVLVSALDSLLINYFNNTKDLTDAHSILYCAAVTACQVANVKFPQDITMRPKPAIPAWQNRIECRITETRVLISKLICFRSGNTRPRVMRFVHRAFSRTGINPRDYYARITERIDYLKQKIYAWANRIRRYKKRVERYTLNRMFQSDQKWVYRNWDKPVKQRNNNDLPSKDNTNNFWRNIWSIPVSHTEGDWIREIERICEPIEVMPAIRIYTEDVANAVRRMPNWKSPGPDGLHNFWLKWLSSSHIRLASLFQSSIESGSLPSFMTTGITHLLHKTGSTTDPKNFRPITCLPTIYKLLTSILRTKINSHIRINNIMHISQNGCRNGTRGTKELLLIDMTIGQQVRKNAYVKSIK